MSQSINPSAPTVVLVHGTFADSSSWNSVTPSLLDQGYPGSCHCQPAAWVEIRYRRRDRRSEVSRRADRARRTLIRRFRYPQCAHPGRQRGGSCLRPCSAPDAVNAASRTQPTIRAEVDPGLLHLPRTPQGHSRRFACFHGTAYEFEKRQWRCREPRTR